MFGEGQYYMFGEEQYYMFGKEQYYHRYSYVLSMWKNNTPINVGNYGKENTIIYVRMFVK